MGSHYFKNDSNVKSEERLIRFHFRGKLFELFSDNGVFSKNGLDEGSNILIEYILKLPLNGRLLDMGCGYGPIGLTLATFFENSFVDMFDINERAVNLARKNQEKLGIKNVEIGVSDGFKNVKNQYNFIFINPPIRAGKQVIYKMFEDTFASLCNDGNLVIVIRKSHGAPSAQKKLIEIFGNCEIKEKNKGYYILQSIKNNV
jgi:16S rRNA (guanine1207-N2)-methyltransferase